MKPTKEFIENFALWEIELKEDGETIETISEMKQVIRDSWNDPELRQLWINFVKERADFRRELIYMANGITQRIKDNAKVESGI